MLARLVILNGKQAGQTVTLSTEHDNIIGREGECTVLLHDPACSRAHALIRGNVGGRWTLEDLESANGTCLNGDQIRSSMVEDGDKVLIGSTWLRFLALSPAPRPLPAPATWVLEDSVNPETSLTSISPGESGPRRRELDCLERVSSEVSRQQEPTTLVRSVLQIICDHLEAAGARMLWQHDHAVFAEHVETQMPAVSDLIIQQAMSTAEAVLVPLGESGPSLRSIFAPLRYLNHVEGVIWVAQRAGKSPFRHEDLCLVASIAHILAPPLKMLLDVQQLQRKNESLLAATSVRLSARSPAMRQILQMVSRVADVDQTVLLRGESGVGKEVIARLIHETGSRREKPLICVNCAALTESLLESELFGHEKGAFTGATEKRPGKFELANGGTVFLDELGAMSASTQAKVLRVLDGHPFERVGGHTTIRTDVRVVAATNANLEAMTQDGLFREDLYHRLRVIEILIPPLRQRPDDIPLLSHYFLEAFTEKTGRRITLLPEALSVLQGYDWPGNVRQLRNTIEQAAILCSGDVITDEDLERLTHGAGSSGRVLPLEDLNRSGIERALNNSSNVMEAARALGMSRSALYRHMKKLGIAPPRTRSH
jgi:Nif-specific regulatory protein